MISIEVTVKGQLNAHWFGWFEDLDIHHTACGDTVLAGIVNDQAALYGIISHLRDLGLSLISVKSEELKRGSYENTRE